MHQISWNDDTMQNQLKEVIIFRQSMNKYNGADGSFKMPSFIFELILVARTHIMETNW